MRSLDGKESSLGHAWAGGTTLLLTSSYTCPKSRLSYPQAAELATRIAGGGIHVAIVYVIEAHPAGDPSPYSGTEEQVSENRRDRILCRQPHTMDDRLKLANEFATRFKAHLPIFVDTMDNLAWSMLGGGPNMGVLVDSNGIVLARQGWFDARSMGTAIDTLMAASPKRVPDARRDEAENNIDSTLGELVQNRKTSELKSLLEQQPELEHRVLHYYGGNEGLLQVAAERGVLDVVKLLVDRGADVNLQTEKVAGPLHLAAERGFVNVVQFLIQHGADVNAKEQGRGPTPLQDALFEEKPDAVAVLTKAGARPNFYSAAATGDMGLLRSSFLQDPTLLFRPDGRGRTALAYAAKTGHLDCVKVLVSLGARDYATAGDGRNAATWAILEEHLEIARILLDSGSDPNCFGVAIANGVPIDFIRAMLDHKADPNHASNDGLRPLHAAAGYNQVNIMQVLLDAGADLNSLTTEGSMLMCGPSYSKGDTALMVAAENGKLSAMEFLIKHGADVNRHNDEGRTPLHYAAARDTDDAVRMVSLLIEYHAEMNVADKDGLTPLDFTDPERRGFGLPTESSNRAALISLLKQHGAVNGKASPSPTQR
jgi:ankyrin repeat protein